MSFDYYSLSPAERAEYKAEIDKINAEARENFSDPQWRREMAAVITERIQEGFDHENLIDLFAQVSRVGFDDRVNIRDVRGLKAHWFARGGRIEASSIREDAMEMPRDSVGFHVNEHMDKFLSNFATAQADLIELGSQRLDAEINKRIVTLLQNGIPSTHDSYVSVSDLSLTALNTAVREVKDESKNAADLAIVGRSTMTEQIIDQLTSDGSNTGFLPETNEDLLMRGVLGRYRGVPIVTLINHKDDEDVSFFPGNELYVVSREAVRVAFYGGIQAKEYEELDNWYWGYLSRQDAGFALIRSERVRRIVDANTAA